MNSPQNPSCQHELHELAAVHSRTIRMTIPEMMSPYGSGRLVHPRSVGELTPHALALCRGCVRLARPAVHLTTRYQDDEDVLINMCQQLE